jgi:S-adenosylmethionine synthetase
VASGLAETCEIQLAYAIGKPDPVSIRVETFGTSTIPESELDDLVAKVFDFTPRGIIDRLNLLRPIYSPTATGGHFGRTPGVDGPFPWEKLDNDILAALLQK